jgi:Protein of unknown function (DUF4058)
MDPYLEHPVLWKTVQARLMVAIADLLQPKLDPLQKCVPRLSSPDQIWADERIAHFRTTSPDLFPQ